VSQRKPYPSDLSDARWALIEPTLSAWRKARLDRRPTGQPAQVELRDVFNAILYVNRTGIPWKYLPHDFPNHGTVYAHYAAWRDEGVLAQLNYDLTGPARVKEGRKPEPTASVIDTQSVKTSTNVPLTSQGKDAAKKIVGRKRGIITDTLGPLLAVTVTAASLSENAVGIRLLDQAKETYPTISKSWVDIGFKNAVIEHGANLGIDVEVVNRNPVTGPSGDTGRPRNRAYRSRTKGSCPAGTHSIASARGCRGQPRATGGHGRGGRAGPFATAPSPLMDAGTVVGGRSRVRH
jgi:transposase